MKNTFLTDQDRKEIEAKIPQAPIVSLTETTDGIKITLSDENGTQSKLVKHGKKGDKGDKGDTGADGADGADGVGIKSIHLTSTNGKVDTYSIELTDGTRTTFTVTNGSNGKDGAAGADGKTPVAGVDYFTAADKASMVADVIAALPLYKGEAEGV